MANTDRAVRAFNHLNPPATAPEVWNAYTEMRERCSIARSDLYGGFDFVTRYADVRSALVDTDSYSSADGVFIPPNDMPPVPALEFDKPQHSVWRKVLDRPLNLRAVRAFEPTITEIVDILIDQFAHAGSADLVSGLAEPLPAIAIGRMVGMDQSQAVQAREIAAALFASIGTPQFTQRMNEFTTYTAELLAERRADPSDDFLTQMASGVVEGMKIDDDTATGLMVAYLVGGHHSTGAGIAGLLRHILSIPGLRDELAKNEKLLPRVVEESLRLTTPLQLFARTTRCPVNIGAQPLPEGRRIMLNLASANRDPREFDDPDAFNTNRTHNRNVAFGAGTHICQGQHLARAELRIAARRLLNRLPDIRIDGDIIEGSLTGGTLMTLHALPVSFTAEQQ